MKVEELIRKREYFKGITWQHLSNCLRSFEQNEYLSSAIWSSVFVESILKDFLRGFGEKGNERDELDPLIKRVANYVNNNIDISENDRYCISDILRRAEEIRSKRNRLVHDTGVKNSGLRSDVNDMLNNAEQIIERYLETNLSREIYEQNLSHSQKNNSKKEVIITDFRVFVSTITPHTFEQTEFIEGFCNRLRECGIEPVRCRLTDFDRRDPMNKVRNKMEECDAFVTIGLERSHVYYYRDKEGSEKQKEAMHRRYTSSWLQLESGMAIGMEKPIFVLCQKDLFSDGIFDRDWNTFVPLELEVPLNIFDPSVDMVLDKLVELKKKNAKGFEILKGWH